MTDQITRMPAVFIGHGSPMNALGGNLFTDAWRSLGRSLPRPRAILSVSAHWYTHGTQVTGNQTPPTIHDFSGFPRPLYELEYPAPGDPDLAARLVQQLAPLPVSVSNDWGLDHGTWSVLVHLYPEADVPIVQLSIDARQPPSFHHALGRQLAPLRDAGILIFGSGNIVHNLARADWGHALAPPPWALEFDARVRGLVLTDDHARLVEYADLGPGASLSVPTPEHYLPLLYVLGTRRPGDTATIPVSGFDLATISMTSIVIGPA